MHAYMRIEDPKVKRKAIPIVFLLVIAVIALLVFCIWYYSLLPQFLNSLLNISSFFCRVFTSGYSIVVRVCEQFFSTILAGLPYILTISIFFSGLFLADRERYVHGFRNSDLNFFKASLNLRITKDPHEIEILVKEGKMWLRVSESYKRNSVYLSFSTVHMIIATSFFVLSLVFLSFNIRYYDVFVVIGIIFFVLSLFGHLGRYQYGIRRLRFWWSIYKRFSWKMCDWFPPLAPPLVLWHLARWKEIGDAIRQDNRFISYLEKLEEYQDLKEFPEYCEPQKDSFFEF